MFTGGVSSSSDSGLVTTKEPTDVAPPPRTFLRCLPCRGSGEIITTLEPLASRRVCITCRGQGRQLEPVRGSVAPQRYGAVALYGTCSRSAAFFLARSPRRSYRTVVLRLAWPAISFTTEMSAPASSRPDTNVRLKS